MTANVVKICEDIQLAVQSEVQIAVEGIAKIVALLVTL